MLRSLTLPATWWVLFGGVSSGVHRESAFAIFTLLAPGLVVLTARRTVVGMLDAIWYGTFARLRRTLVATRITGAAAAQPDPHKYRDYKLACAAAAA
jgi:hypothetical protein